MRLYVRIEVGPDDDRSAEDWQARVAELADELRSQGIDVVVSEAVEAGS